MMTSGAEVRTPLQAIVIGAGIAGIGMAIALRRHGTDSFVILERASDLGGVWRDNVYPGAACDVPSHVYSFSFALNPAWSRRFARQDEILAYLQKCTSDHDLHRHMRFGAEVVRADYDEAAALWCATLSTGETFVARLLISATGQLSRPALPPQGTWRLPTFHSAAWDHDCDLTGKRVAVIGTGASTTQFVPVIAPRVGRLTIFQRAPAYILPRRDHPYSDRTKRLFRAWPLLMKLYRAWLHFQYEIRAIGFLRVRWLLDVFVGRRFRNMLSRQILDAATRAKLAPAYPPGCKRVLLSDDYLPALSRSNVELVTLAVSRVTDDGVETTDGRTHPCDVVIYATGFSASDFLAPMIIRGRDGHALDASWRGGARAYLGMTIPGFPNFFVLYGPNTNLGHNSIIGMIEGQIKHVMRCWRRLNASGSRSVEIGAESYERFDRWAQKRLARSVWSQCRSWYIDASGRNTANWPGTMWLYRWLTDHSSLTVYRFAPPRK